MVKEPAFMHLKLVSSASALALLMGCGAYYEEVPAFGQTDPNYAQVDRQIVQQNAANIGVPNANQAQQGVDPGQQVQQDVNVGQAQDQYADTDPSALTDFKSTLDPYGTWADDGTYGTVWQPDAGVVGADFAPYVSAGHWTYDNDYTWVSDYDWGWAPFHYGRWVYVNGRGWCWIPGRTYAGAWVSWRVGGPGYGYIGWGPMAPTWGWRGGAAYGYGFAVNTPYSFCGTNDLFSPNGLHGRVLAGPQVSTVAQSTHVYTDGRSPAHPTVGGPPPSHIGLTAPQREFGTAGIAGVGKAQAFARPSTAGVFGARQPSYMAGTIHPQQVPSTHYPPQGTVGGEWNHPVATAPHYYGVAPHPYRSYPTAVPYHTYGSSYGGQPYSAPYRSYSSAPTYHSPVYSGGGSPYRSYSSAPTYHSPVYSGGGGGGFRSAPSGGGYGSHSSSHSSGGGGGHGGHR